jgi:hypothetical protein
VILADTSVWVDHFRKRDDELCRQLQGSNISVHPFIVAELALGSLAERVKTLSYLELLPQVRVAQTAEVRQMIEARALSGGGIGFVDAHLIASTLLTPHTVLWSRDRRLRAVAASLGIGSVFP